MSKNNLYLNPQELKDYLGYTIKNNRYLQKNGILPVAVNITGEAGIGKTSTIKQVAEENGLQFVRLQLSEMDELSDLIGFPLRQFEMCKDGKKCEWVDEQAIHSFEAEGYKFTGKNQMGYCPPEWIADKKESVLLLLDDAFRADMRFMQATMSLIQFQTYASWCLPPDSHIVLSNNPADGDYMVNEIDPAQRTRFININMKFDEKVWAKWAEFSGIDERG